MIHSIHTRLLLAVGLVVVAGLVAVGVLASRVTRREFDHFLAFEVRAGRPADADSVRARLEDHYRRHGTWDGVDAVIASLCGPAGGLTRQRMVVLDANNRVAAATDSGLLAPSLQGCTDSVAVVRVAIRGQVAGVGRDSIRVLGTGGSLPIPGTRHGLVDAQGQAIGSFIVAPAGSHALSRPRRQFLLSIDRGVFWAVLAAGIVALGSTALLSRRILRPVEELTAIARAMGRGDLSQRAQVGSRDEIGELARAFNTMADGLARIERLRRGMVHDVAHELRTPLTNIRGQLEAVQDGLLAPEPAVIDSLHEEALALQRVVEDLQELALAEAGQLRLVPQAVALRDLVERVARPLWPTADRGLDLRLDVAPDLRVRADPHRLGQVLRNLLQNALAHTSPGGRIGVEARVLAPEPGAASLVEIAVRDTGSGIEAGDLPFVFERFYRGDRSRSRATGGAGLGLAIARQLIEAQGGTIRAESPPGEGASLIFTLPVAGATDSDAT